MNQVLLKNVTLGIPTTGNNQALLIALTSVLQGTVLPKRILIRADGHFPAFANFYLEQLADVARQKGVEFLHATVASAGLRGAVDWLMNNCGTKYLWVIADDVLPANSALNALYEGAEQLESRNEPWGYVCGNKQDVNNRRQWPDYTQGFVEPFDFCPTHGNYIQTGPLVVKNRFLDNSHALFSVLPLKAANIKETAFNYGFQCGGDDTLFGLMIQKAGLSGWFSPHSQAYHLEKESQNFNEPTARAEAIYRQAQILGIELTRSDLVGMFPYTKRYGQLPTK